MQRDKVLDQWKIGRLQKTMTTQEAAGAVAHCQKLNSLNIHIPEQDTQLPRLVLP